MSERNADIVRALIPPPETNIAELIRNDELFEQASKVLEPFVDPQVQSIAVWQGGTGYTGLDGFRRLWLDWLEPWVEYHSQTEEVTTAGDVVVVFVRDRGRSAGSDAEVELLGGSVWELREGRIVAVKFCGSRAEALETAGLA